MINLETWVITIIKIGGYILVAALIFYIAKRFFSKIIKKVLRKKYKESEELEAKQKTILGVIDNTIKIILIIVVLLMALSDLNVNIAPLLAGAGVVGFAISFACQNLIKDFLSGMFLLIEDQLDVGDRVQFGPPINQEGEVIDFTLRKTTIRNDEGALVFVPNNQISYLINKSKNLKKIKDE